MFTIKKQSKLFYARFCQSRWENYIYDDVTDKNKKVSFSAPQETKGKKRKLQFCNLPIHYFLLIAINIV
jgi:hypothetical protein